MPFTFSSGLGSVLAGGFPTWSVAFLLKKTKCHTKEEMLSSQKASTFPVPINPL